MSGRCPSERGRNDKDMMKLAEFSSIYKVSERHVRRLIQKYETDMAGHYEKHGNEGTFLDDVGVEILKSKLRATFEVTVESASERERQLETALTELSMRYAAACEKLVENAGAVALLEAAKERSLALEARAENAEAGRLEAIREIEDLRKAAEEREAAMVDAERRAIDAETVAEINAQEAAAATQDAERAKTAAADLQAQLDLIAVSKGFKRRKLLKELRKAHEGKKRLRQAFIDAAIEKERELSENSENS